MILLKIIKLILYYFENNNTNKINYKFINYFPKILIFIDS